jgi:intracellular sulfur oxidation DsrE/DsrF family protein
MIRSVSVFTLALLAVSATADDPPRGKGAGKGMGKSRGPDATLRADQEDFHYLLERHADIRRTVKNTAAGVETLTESDDPQVAARLKKHVAAMKKRMESGRGLRWWDPLFAAMFQEHAKVRMEIRETGGGVAVMETSDDPRVVPLIQAHAGVVSLFVKHGFEEAGKSHAVPSAPPRVSAPKLAFPVVPKFGGVVFEREFIDAPRAGTKALFDVAGVGKPEEVVPGLERAARLLNLAGAAGLKPGDVKLSVVLHGDALRAALRNDVHREKFGVDNPNAEVLPMLRKAGVEIVVCGQSLGRAGFDKSHLMEDVPVAASAMSLTLNRQQDGFGVLVFR